MDQPYNLEETNESEEEDSPGSAMVGKEKKQELEEESDDDFQDEQLIDGVWQLRKEYEMASKALRKRSNDHGQRLSSILDEEETSNRSAEDTSGARRPGLIHRATDPSPMRDFSMKINWNCVGTNVEELVRREHLNNSPTISEATDNESQPFHLKKSIVNEERFLISSYDLAKRRLSLPLSTIDHRWNEDKDLTQELGEKEGISNNLIKTCQRSLLKPDHSPMDKRRRQSAWTRRPATSIDEEIYKRLTNRRMSELPALSTLATKRRNIPHTLSVPTGLKRRGSRSGNALASYQHDIIIPLEASLLSTLDYQNLRSASTRAKNEMLATLSMSSWIHDKGPLRLQEISRRKTCHNGYGVMVLKKKEEKRLMVAHEILQTEKNYIKALETLNEVFIEPIKNACVISDKDFRTMFPKQLHVIKSGHVRFLNELDERLNNWKWQGVLGDIFAKLGNSYHIDFMTVYSEYVSNFPKSIAIINKYSRNSHKFRKLMEKCTTDPRCERLNLSAYLLTPIQRLPRYVLLLRQLSKYTDPNHPDSFHIEISLEKMIGIINLLNSSIQNSTRMSRNTPARRSSRRRKRGIFKAKETMNPESISPRKSSDESEASELSGRSTPCTKDLTLDLSSTDQQNKSSDYGSLTNSEATSEPTSSSPSSGSSSKSSFLKVILRNSSDSKKKKRRPLSTTEVEIFCRKDKDLSDVIPKHDDLKRSASGDSFGSLIRHKFGSFRRKNQSLPRNLSLERLNDCKMSQFARHNSHERLHEEDSKERFNKLDSDILEEHNKRRSCLSETLNSTSSGESCNGSREHVSLSHAHDHSDSDDLTSKSPDSRPSSRRDFNGNDSSFIQKSNSNSKPVVVVSISSADQRLTTDEEKNHGDKNNKHEEKTPHRKLRKRNSFTDVMKHLFVTKRRSSNSPERMKYLETPSQNTEQLLNSETSKEKISTV